MIFDPETMYFHATRVKNFLVPGDTYLQNRLVKKHVENGRSCGR